MECRRSPYEGKSMVAPMVRVSTLGFRLMCSREYYNGIKQHQHLLPTTTTPPVSSSTPSTTPIPGTAFFTEEIISMKLMKTKREVRTYNIPLNIPLSGTAPSNSTFSLLPPGYMVPWSWAAQELLFSIDDDVRTPPSQYPSHLGHMGLVYKAGEDTLGTASWESHYDGQEELDAYRDLYEAPTTTTTPIDATIISNLFTNESIDKEVEFIATRLLQVRRNVIVDTPHHNQDTVRSSMDEVRRILGKVADATKKLSSTTGDEGSSPSTIPKAPDGTRIADSPYDIVSALVGGAVLLDDISLILRELAEERSKRVVALDLPDPTAAIQALVTTPLLDSILVPIPIVEFATYDNFKNIVKRTPALQVVQKTLLNPFAEGDYRCVDVRMEALCGVLGVRAESVGSKRQRDCDTTTATTGTPLGGGVGRVICQLGAPNALFAAKAAAVVCDDVDGLDLNSGCPKGFSADNNMGAALMSWPVLTGRILGGLNEGANNGAVVARRRGDITYLRQVARLVTPPSQQQDTTTTTASPSGTDWFHAEFGLHCPVSLKTRLFEKVADSERHLLLAVAGAQELVQNQAEPSSSPANGGGAEVDDSTTSSLPIVCGAPLSVPHAISLHCRLKEQRSDTLPLEELGASVVTSLRSVGAITAWVPSEDVREEEEEAPTSASPTNNNHHANSGRKLSKKDKKQQRKGGPAMDLASLIKEDAQVKLSVHRRGEEATTTTSADESLVPTPVDFNTISFVFNGSVVSSNTSGPQPFYGTLVGRSSMWDPSVMGRLGGGGSATALLPPRTTFNALLINYDEVLCTVGIPPNPTPPLHSSRPLNYLRKWSIELMKHIPTPTPATSPSSSSSPTSGSPYTLKADVAAADASIMQLAPNDDTPTALQKLASGVHNTLLHMGHMYRSLCLFYGAYRTQISFFKYHLTRSFGEFPTSKVSIRELLELQIAALQLTTTPASSGGCGNAVLDGCGGDVKAVLEAAVRHARVPIPSGGGIDETDPDANVGNLVRTLFESLQYAKGPIELYSTVESCLAISLGVPTPTAPSTTSSSPHPQTVRYLLEFAAKEEVVPTIPK